MKRLLMLFCLVLASCLSQATEHPQAAALMEQGSREAAAQHYGEAIQAFEQVIALPESSSGCRALGKVRIIQCLLHERQFDRAKAVCQELQAMNDSPPHLQWEAVEAIKQAERVQAGLPARDPAESRVKAMETPAPGAVFYVAVDGNDTQAGTREASFATLQRALAQVAALNAQGAWPAGGVQILLRKGVYAIKESVKLGSEVSGREGAPLTIAACDGEAVHLSGGVAVTGFHPVEDPGILARLPEEARDKVQVCDLKAQGITDYGHMEPRGFAGKAYVSAMELFLDGQPMQLARWPNEGFVRTGKVLDPGEFKEGRGGVFDFENERLGRWMQARDIWLYGYWFWDWADNAIGVTSIDPGTHRIQTAHTSPYGIKEGQSFYAFNLLEEIDQPGEWYLDRETGLLYFYPPADLAKVSLMLSLTREPLIEANQVSYVNFQGLIVELGAGDGLVINGGEHCLVAGCLVRRLGATGITLKEGHGHGVLGCELHTLGRGGVVMAGGDRKTLTPGGHVVENCEIHHFSRIDRTYTPAVQIDGVGNRIAHNNFHDTPCHAIRLEGNDHVVELNDVHDVVRESDDQGGLDMFYNPGYRGNILRYNFWHDIGNGRACGQAGIRLDDAISGTLIYGNIFSHCSEANFGGVQVHGGQKNWVDNNVFVDCRYGVSFSAWGKERWTKFVESEAVQALLNTQVDTKNPPYSVRYPDLAHLEEGWDINNLWRNVAFRCGSFLTRDQGIQNEMNDMVTNEDPGFVDAAAGNFGLKEDAKVFDAIGFAPIPFQEIGLYDDAFRARVKALQTEP